MRPQHVEEEGAEGHEDDAELDGEAGLLFSGVAIFDGIGVMIYTRCFFGTTPRLLMTFTFEIIIWT